MAESAEKTMNQVSVIRGTHQEIGGKKKVREGTCMKGFISKRESSKGKPEGYSRESFSSCEEAGVWEC